MTRKRVVYVSSSFEDLKQHRSALKLALEKAGCDVASMETYPAFDQRPLQKCREDVAAADVYVLLLAHRYGFRPPQDNPQRRSITELEYEQALAGGRPCLAFTVDPEHPWSPRWIDRGEDADALEAFRARVEERHGVNRFTDPDQLTGLVLAALSRLETTAAEPAAEMEGGDTKHNLPALPLDPELWPGQETAFRDLSKRLEAAGPPLVVRGMDGVGKTSLALRACHALREGRRWPAICLLDARAGGEAMAQELVNFSATRLDLTPPEEFEPTARAAWCLEHWPGAPAPVLLLLDDLIDPAHLQGVATGLPDRFRLLITTRLRLDGAIREISLAPLADEAAVRVLELRGERDRFTGEHREAALAIAGKVGGLPLALTLLGRQLRRDPDLSLASLQRRLAERGALAPVLQGTAPELLVERGLAAGFRLIREQLGAAEAEMALCLGELAPSLVPWDLLARCRPEALGEEEWEEARGELIHQSLLERPRSGGYRLHPLLHDLLAAEAAGLVEAERGERQGRVAAALASWARSLPDVLDAEQRERWQSCLPQLEAAAGWPIRRFSAADACWPPLALGRFLSAQGLYGLAVPRLEAALERADPEASGGPAHRAACLEAIGGIQRERGELAAAEATTREALALREAQGSEDLEVASALNALGLVLHEAGSEEADGLLRRALTLRQGQLPPQDERLITSCNNLAKELARRGETSEARRLYQQGLDASAGRASILAVALHNNLAWLEWQTGRSPEAMEQLGEAVRLAGEGLGERHPKRGMLLKNLAVLEDELGKKEAAEAHYREALEILEATWGKEDPRSQDCRLTLEVFLKEQQAPPRRRRKGG